MEPDTWRVGLLVDDFPKLSERFVALLASALVERVDDLRILTTAPRPEPPPHHAVVAQAGLLDRVHNARWSGRFDPRLAWKLGRGTGRVGLLGLAAMDAALPRKPMAVTRMMARQPAFDVFHAQFGYMGKKALRHRRYGTLRTRALVTHFRGSDITRHVRDHGPDYYADLMRGGDGFIANCEHFRQIAIGLGCPPERISVVGSPIDTDQFQPPPHREPYRDRPLRLVAVGRLVGKKGLPDAVDAMARLDGLDATLDIYGEGPLREDLEHRIATQGLGDRVVLHGAATGEQVLRALHGADAKLAPSVTAEDGDADAPVNTLKEAMATGLPVIATRHGGIPELVVPGRNGYLVPERDPSALAAAIRELASCPDDWTRMGEAGRADVIDAYAMTRVTEKTLAVYDAAIRRAEGG
ncbi:glycosyltransferase [Jannaschia sp. LMIT008]|uniref:glycosyltransferase n=1 Tax=Jannaschia maritima TaxID=3032585 RepID=UPI0028120227|nr:glycosyltransferase [Jannaschia sp. LMIT008]